MKTHVKSFLVYLPLMVLLTVCAWFVVSVLPNMRLNGDMIAWLLELPVITCYAIAAGGATALSMQLTGINLDNDLREQLLGMAIKGDVHARNVVVVEAAFWLAFLALWSVVFFPHY